MATNLQELQSAKLARFYMLSADEENYPLLNFANSLIKDKLPTDTIRHSFTADRYFSFNTVLDILQSGNLFTTHNLIEISYKTKPTLEQQSQLAEILAKLSVADTLVLLTGKLDRKDMTASWIKEALSIGGFVCGLNQDNMNEVLQAKLNKYKLELGFAAKEMLLNMNYGNPVQLLGDVEKLSCLYPQNSKLTIANLEEHLVDNALYSVFQLSPAYLRGDLKTSLLIFNNVYQVVGDAVLICWVIVEDLRKLLKLKGAIKQSISEQQAIKNLRLWGDAVTALPKAHKRLSYSVLLELLDDIANVDLMIKGVKSGDLRLKFLEVITKLCVAHV